MAEGQITLRVPGAVVPIPEVVIDCYLAADEFYSRELQGLAAVTSRSAVGTAQITGSLFTAEAITVLGMVTEAQALDLGAMALWSSGEYQANRDGHLEMDYEVEYVEPQPSPHPKTLIQILTTPYGYQYGYPRLNVALTLPADYRKRRGVNRGGVLYSIVQFAAVEV